MDTLKTTLNTSTLAALEEMLQNTSRSVPHDFLPVHFFGGASPGQVVGHLSPDFIPFIHKTLQEHALPLLHLSSDRFSIDAAKPIEISDSLANLAEQMQQAGLIPGWRQEQFAWIDQNGHAYFMLERAAFRTFGLRSTAIHVNGHTRAGKVWLGRRSQSKSIDPGRLDNLAAGGIAAQETPWNCAYRELWEEAGVPNPLSQRIEPVGRIHMRRPLQSLGFHDEQLYIYDLALPENFIPTNHDGEVSGFIEISLSEAAARILADEFTSDAAIVMADFILRKART
ncbi:8-oxo-dGTP pyrophosphatase MutT, NUDIX family [Polynucleobacter meluiroseus]|uniref:8-oxo-dGTP pyrophosphatase MutT, NUDIX family n=1 Tax=Polynucleobacter meluiroseus TaxID=1938814 RepID=A0A240E193_9BURK|nr:NUDIX domain-containing protein [Polynucleobacter meluiroseus]SNX28630.1 8-oxo-dGTP pyrophosphatase MutT, NUDIX family [Polynucleobacter meluiroseus]